MPPLRAIGRHPNVQAEPAFQRGLFEVQDLGSQIAAKLSGARPGKQMLDYCAEAGSKTLALAAQIGNKGQIHAYDAEHAQLAPIFDRLKQAEVRNAQAHANSSKLTPLEGQINLMLVDAPCTSSGTWRRRPDAKWRLSEQQLERRKVEQREVLDAAKAYVKPGRQLVYITYSLFAPENSQQVAAFLQANPNYAAADTRPMWQEAVSASDSLRPLFKDGNTILSPLSTSTDSFFISVLRREK